MTLAAFLFVCLCSSTFSQEATPAQDTQQTQTAKPADAPATPPSQEQPNAPANSQAPAKTSETPAASTPTTPGPAKPTQVKPRRRKKKAVNVNCVTPSPAAGSAPTQGDSSAAANGANASATPVNCPPPRKIVRNGGTSEPSIELLGNADPQDSRKRSTDQQLSAIDENLKKLAGRQLTASQQETVSQIHHYVDQSKAAVAAGDAERGHNLALKARLLSDELVKP